MARLLHSGGMEANAEDRARAGLCAGCAHVRVIVSDKGSRFYQCQRGLTDPAFRKYPILPVWRCRGYEENPDAGRSPDR
jgi:hypothetical protein